MMETSARVSPLLLTAVWTAALSTTAQLPAPSTDTAAFEEIAIYGERIDSDSATGSRLALTVMETPATVDIIDGNTIRERMDTSVMEAVTRSAGFTNDGHPGNGSQNIAARGFRGQGTVTKLFDSSNYYTAFNTITFPFDTWGVERIEVLKGPSSVLYGEGGIGGAFNVIPKRPRQERASDMRVSFGEDNTRFIGLGLTGGLSDKLAYRLDYSNNQSDNWVDRGDSRAPSSAPFTRPASSRPATPRSQPTPSANRRRWYTSVSSLPPSGASVTRTASAASDLNSTPECASHSASPSRRHGSPASSRAMNDLQWRGFASTHPAGGASRATRQRTSPAVVIAAGTPSTSPSPRAIALAPRWPPSNGTTALPSSATATTAGSPSLSASAGARALIRMPAAHTPTMSVPSANSRRSSTPTSSNATSGPDTRGA